MLRNPLYVYGEGEVNVPAHLNFGQFMLEKLWNSEDKIAMINGSTHQKITFRDMAKNCINIALSLTQIGVKRGDTIAICSENRQEFLSLVIGIICSGATITPTNLAYTKDELTYVLSISKPKMIFCSPLAYKTHQQTFKNLRFMKIVVFGNERLRGTLMFEDMVKDRGINFDMFESVNVTGQKDTALILYSSGTTGLPKGVMLTHLNLLTTCSVSPSTNPKEIGLFIAPWYHTMGLVGILRVLCSGSTSIYLPKFGVNEYLQTIEKYRVQQIIVPPPILVILSKTECNYDISSLKLIISGAAPLREETIKAVKAKFPNVKNILQGYGMTESTLAITRDTYDKAHSAKGVGQVLTGTVIKVVDIETRKPLGANKPGEICVKGPTVMKGYIGKDKKDDFDEEGFFKTGDIGYYDEDEYFFIVDRLKELIKYKGYQVAPAEIEAVLLQHPSIRDAGVVGVPHESGGEAPRAYVVIQSAANVTEEEVKSFVAEKLSNPKHLRGGVRFVSEIPKNPSGKILRRQLKGMAKLTSKL
ncbi:unnamed protein product, partial [Brenthis ino]